jgi:hypothetical protein
MPTSTALILKVEFGEDIEVTDGIIAEIVQTLLYHHDHPDFIEKMTFIHDGTEVMTRSTLERAKSDAKMQSV